MRGGRLDREDGAAALEFAIIGVLLMLLVFGVLVFGAYIFEYQALSAAAREGARVAAVQSDVNGDGTFDDSDVDEAVSEAALPYTITGNPTAVDSGGNAMNCADESSEGLLVYVTWSQDFNIPNVFGFLPALDTTDKEIRGAFRCE